MLFKISGDGNCLFQSLAHIGHGTEHGYLQMRTLLVTFIKSNIKAFEPLIIGATFDQHIDQMANARVWGSHVELQAAASLFNMPVFLCTTSHSANHEYKWICYKLFPSEELTHPAPQDRPSNLDRPVVTGQVGQVLT